MATSKKDDEAPAEGGTLQEEPTPAAAEHGDHDRIVMASRRPDGSMAQIAPEFIGDKDVAVAAAQQQLAEQATSAVDVAARGVTSTPEGVGDSKPDADVQALKDAQEKAAAAAKDRAAAEVEQHHQGLGD
ncbi:hypothetical protein K5X85_29190 [Streptomyces sp. A144]|uniref:hypothetical protein n=1 Tax=Streptomyces sp. A144 TaxID=2871487 RepID=UPI001CBE2932|nr:hypothetical protein [Streptomyces sp. A144]UAX56805.1 hypothetical protein K5X85_29190 [Streptomyces sp. A144]